MLNIAQKKIQNALDNLPQEIVFDNINAILIKYETPEGHLYLRYMNDTECEGVADNMGNYCYVRLNGNIKVDKIFEIYPLRLVICLPNCANIDEIIFYIEAYLKRELNLLENTVVELNKQVVFKAETGRKTKEQRSEVSLAYLDFSMKIVRNKNLECITIKCNPCND
ncbi:hypothetical protein WAF17_21205 [Bernardetia sp. ABR2-2B]|uniref:hypothetical protein n=1 Tax=Bernardetia sp. ABR2-2B TaxID=3127472 RepID=UPI0030CBCAF8